MRLGEVFIVVSPHFSVKIKWGRCLSCVAQKIPQNRSQLFLWGTFNQSIVWDTHPTRPKNTFLSIGLIWEVWYVWGEWKLTGKENRRYTLPSISRWTNPFENYARQIGSFPQGFGVKIQNVWNHNHKLDFNLNLMPEHKIFNTKYIPSSKLT